jgi:cardiolipin synthase (CMP-forming)
MPGWINLPNLFTLLRLVLTPVVVMAILDGRHVLAFVVFILASLTDFLDGAAARRRGPTQIGAYLDPIADKCLLSGGFLALAAAHSVPWWLVALVFARDLVILLGVALFLLLTPIRRFPPSIWGKVSTCVQICTVAAWLTCNALGIQTGRALSFVMLWPCAAFTVWSGLDYVWRGIAKVRGHIEQRTD